MQGWSGEGIDKFNQLCDFVVKDRRSTEGVKFEEAFKKHHEEELMIKKGGIYMGDCNNSDVDEDDEGQNPKNKMAKAYNHLQDLVEDSDSDGELEVMLARKD